VSRWDLTGAQTVLTLCHVFDVGLDKITHAKLFMEAALKQFHQKNNCYPFNVVVYRYDATAPSYFPVQWCKLQLLLCSIVGVQ
jgi:hypothetical protein